MYSFTAMEATRIPTVSTLRVTSSGFRIFSTLLLRSSTPIKMMSMATTRPETYSSRPWPKGWSLSGFCPASLNPSMDTTEEPASERLLKASAVTATEPLRTPARAFPANSRMLRQTPTVPQRRPYFCRTSGRFTCW